MYLNILLLLLFLLIPIMQIFFKPLPIYTQIRLEREAALFFRHTEKEVNEATSYEIASGNLLLHTAKGEVTYRQLEHKIIRVKSDQPKGGNLEMAHFVKEVHFSTVVDKQVFQIALKLEENGIEYEAKRFMGLKINRNASAEHGEEDTGYEKAGVN